MLLPGVCSVLIQTGSTQIQVRGSGFLIICLTPSVVLASWGLKLVLLVSDTPLQFWSAYTLPFLFWYKSQPRTIPQLPPNPLVLWPGSTASGFPGQAVGLKSPSKYVPCQKPGLGWLLPAGVLDSCGCTAVTLHLSDMASTHFCLWELWAENQESGEE